MGKMSPAGNIEIPFVGGGYTARNPNSNAQVSQNLYLERDNTGGRSIAWLTATPGAKAWKDMSVSVEGRAFAEFEGELYSVFGNTVYKHASDRSQTSIGTIGTSSGFCDINIDDNNMVVFDSTNGWIWNGSTFTAISAAGFPVNITGATYQDGRHIVSSAGTGQFFICGLTGTGEADPASWSALDFATAEGAADNLVSPVSLEVQLWLIGEKSTEIWFNSGATFPFARDSSGFTLIGCNSKRSIAHFEDDMLFLSDKNQVVRKTGFRLEPVSTYQIDFLISTMPITSDAVGNMYFQEGQLFYELTFPTGNTTICYSLATGFWHTRASGASDARSRANAIIRFNNQVLVADYINGNIYEYDLATFTDGGAVKRAIRTAQVINERNQKMYFSSFEVDMETGHGGTARLQVSHDGGHTFSNERALSMGALGEYRTKIRWNRLGSGRDFIPRLIISDAVPRNLYQAYLRGTVSDV